MNPYKILMIDDEPNVLAGFRRTVGRQFDIVCAESGHAALTILAQGGPFAVIVTDMRMPGMDGLQLLEQASQYAKESVCMMLTGNADQQTAVDAINRGRIFRFLNKPCDSDLLSRAISDAIRQYELVTAERTLLRDTLAGSVNLLLGALELSNPRLVEHQTLVRQGMLLTLQKLGLPLNWQFDLASSLALLGLVTIPGVDPSNVFDETSLAMCAMIGGELIGNIPRLTTVARIVERQRERGALPEVLTLDDPTTLEVIGARVLRFSLDMAREVHRCGTRDRAMLALARTEEYDSRLCGPNPLNRPPRAIGTYHAATSLPAEPGPDVTTAVPKPLTLSVGELRSGMVLADPVCSSDGTLLLSAGHELSSITVMSLRNFCRAGAILGKVQVQPPPPRVRHDAA